LTYHPFYLKKLGIEIELCLSLGVEKGLRDAHLWKKDFVPDDRDKIWAHSHIQPAGQSGRNSATCG
jgi:hypothetical protein